MAFLQQNYGLPVPPPTLLDSTLESFKIPSTDRTILLTKLYQESLTVTSLNPMIVPKIFDLLYLLQQTLSRQMQSTQQAIVTISLIIRYLSLFLKSPAITQELAQLFQRCSEDITRYAINTMNITVYSHALQSLSGLIRNNPRYYNLFYFCFRELCVRPYTARFTPVQLENVSLLVEFQVSRIATVAMGHNAMNTVLMLYPVTTLFSIHSEPTLKSRVPEKISDRYPGIERISTGDVSEILIGLVERTYDAIEKKAIRYPYRYGMNQECLSQLFSLWKAVENKLGESIRSEQNRDNLEEKEYKAEVTSLAMEEVKIEEEEMEEVVNTKMTDLNKDDTVLGVIDYSLDAITRMCTNYEKSTHPEEREICEKIVSDILLMLMKDVDIENVRMEGYTLCEYLIHVSTKDGCRNIKLIAYFMFELYGRRLNELYMSLFNKVMFQLTHPPQDGLITFFNLIPYIPKEIECLEEMLSMLRIPKSMQVEDTQLDQGLGIENSSDTAKDGTIVFGDRSVQLPKVEKIENDMTEKKEEPTQMEMVISHDEANIETVQRLIGFVIQIIKQTPQSHVILLPLLIKHLYCLPEHMIINVIGVLCTEIYPDISGGLLEGGKSILHMCCESKNVEYIQPCVKLIFSMCLYKTNLLIEFIKSLKQIRVTEEFMENFVGGFPLLFRVLFHLIKDNYLVEYVNFMTTSDADLNGYILPLLQAFSDFYLPLSPEHEISLKVKAVVDVVLSKFIASPAVYFPFVIVVLPVVIVPHMKMIFWWILTNFGSNKEVLSLVFGRVLLSQATRYKFEDLIVAIMENKSVQLVDQVELCCGAIMNYKYSTVYTNANFSQAVDVITGKNLETSVCLRCLLFVLNVGKDVSYEALSDKLLRTVKGSDITDEVMPIFSALVEKISPQGINLLMLLSEEKMKNVLISNQKLLNNITNMLPSQKAKTDISIIRTANLLKK
ncbi:hypothetical protein EIN_022860 [Entamoeba invadens IP1]|uniref:hypothetical protein n=1 Tax=Entamoeba invadens IP1 TaxID=370355 RepID=UPI0002C3F911|nr:hypothetical protein EIN_022860 [Entamoeba invadens IP1]ELP90647.1 hypothetical protein EIN_022860 [Entamoeba invadens IP1]|eukprot:XP_004257418.1 hypothetical protein EIN_022860 [Entamoeba invadens IP1]